MKLLLTRAHAFAYSEGHYLEVAQGSAERAEAVMDRGDKQGSTVPDQYRVGDNRVESWVAYHLARPPAPFLQGWHARYLGALAAADREWTQSAPYALRGVTTMPEARVSQPPALRLPSAHRLESMGEGTD